MAKFELKLLSNGQFMFSLVASNGQIILASERYKSRQSAAQGITSVKINSQVDSRYLRKVAKDNSYYFVLTAVNGEAVGMSELYSSSDAMEKGIAAVKAYASEAPIT